MTGFLMSVSRRAALAVVAGALAAGAWAADAPRVKFATTMGDFVVELEPEKAPKTVENFLQYVNDKHYDGTVFHRVIDNFMVQGGGFTADMQQKPTRPPVVLEAGAGLKNQVGTIAMARTADPNSATSQFFINVRDNVSLDAPNPDGHGYAVFGKVVSGMDVISKIKAVPTTTKGPYQNVPATPVVITSATVVK
ncbi:peptidylprolyl isomerase [Caenimonas terrae]|uniref:Peptidyl-prolyl cis-trans isomerase n=1 Tax=Caenimonas terrae TaxID=696074 RepID=A0ABW0NGZ1_9BURK